MSIHGHLAADIPGLQIWLSDVNGGLVARVDTQAVQPGMREFAGELDMASEEGTPAVHAVEPTGQYQPSQFLRIAPEGMCNN